LAQKINLLKGISPTRDYDICSGITNLLRPILNRKDVNYATGLSMTFLPYANSKYGGFAPVGLKTSYMFSNYYETQFSTAHEFGHSIGLEHIYLDLGIYNKESTINIMGYNPKSYSFYWWQKAKL
jgi:hypothetical protein